MLILDAQAVRAAYPMRAAIPLMAEAMRRYSGGQVTQPLRTILSPSTEDGVFASMPCHVAGDEYGYGVKVIMAKPGNAARGLPVYVGALVVFDPDTGYPMALLDAAAVTAVRTAAVSAVATDALARADAGDLAVLGSGVQARGHLEAISLVRELRRVRVFSRTAAHAEDFAGWAKSSLDIVVEVMPTVAGALDGADLICTTLSTSDPVVAAEHLSEGAHVNAVGASVPSARELESAAVARCAVFVDSRESAAGESGDLRVPLAEGVISVDHVRAELGEVLLGQHAGRSGAEEITLFKSLGLAVQDVVSGFAVASTAAANGIGHSVPYGP